MPLPRPLLPGILPRKSHISSFCLLNNTFPQPQTVSPITMRTSVAAVAISLALGAMAEFGTGPSPFTPPPGSACLGPSDSYRDSNTMVETERRRRSLGITNLPRQWARDLLSNVVEKADQVMGARCVSLQCACVHAGRKTSYGVYTKGQCPVEHGASWEACNIQEDGYTVRLLSLFAFFSFLFETENLVATGGV